MMFKVIIKFGLLMMLINTSYAAVGYMAPNASSYVADHNVTVEHDDTTTYEGGYYPYPYYYPMAGVGVVIPVGGSSSANSNSDQYGSQDNVQSGNVTNDSNGEVTLRQ